jgi:serine/threonine protein kinase/formylglycine-generating enzyme required for sulfatase activity
MVETPRVLELLLRWENQREAGREPSAEELCAGCPELLEAVRAGIRRRRAFNTIVAGDDETGAWFPQPDADALKLADLLAPRQSADELGRLGHYRILNELGHGGMGMVLLAEDMELQRPVALKVILPRHAQQPQVRARFLREARAAAKLKHDNVVTIYQVGEERGILFIAMELLKGASLEDYLRKRRELVPGQIIRLAREMVEGLKAAHAVGLVHRDIKPANIWLEAPKGRVKLLDFGLARDERPDFQVTQSGAVVGTPKYMSPEQADGKPLDARSDLFSLGVVLYRICTGKEPFVGPNMYAVLQALAVETPAPVCQLNPTIPRALENLIERLMAKGPDQRIQTAREVGEALSDLRKAAMAGSAAALVENGFDIPEQALPWAISITEATAGSAPANMAKGVATPEPAPPFAISITQANDFGVRPEGNSSKGRTARKLSGVKARSAKPARRQRSLWWIAAFVTAALFIGGAVVVVPALKNRPQNERKDVTSAGASALGAPPGAGVEFTGHNPGEEIKVELAAGVKMTFCWVPAGEAQLGAPNAELENVLKLFKKEPDWLAGEAEEKRGSFKTKGFWMGKYPVTQEEWQAVMGENPSYFRPGQEHIKKAGITDTSRFPVESVSWVDCQKFVKKLSAVALPAAMRNWRVALPQEDRWEYACRGGLGNKRAFYFGDELNGKLANCNGTAPFGTATIGPYLERTSKVGSYESLAPHPWGLCDMHGNVRQWCSNKADGDDRHVMRGGSWSRTSRLCRSAHRAAISSIGRSSNNGLRVVVLPP